MWGPRPQKGPPNAPPCADATPIPARENRASNPKIHLVVVRVLLTTSPVTVGYIQRGRTISLGPPAGAFANKSSSCRIYGDKVHPRVVNGFVIGTAIVQILTVGVAAYGAYRCIRLQRFGSDRRLKALGWFFGLFAVAVGLLAIWQMSYGYPRPFPDGAGFGGRFGPPGNETSNQSMPDGPRLVRGGQFFRPEGDERVNIILAGHHLFMLASLAVAVVAFGRKRPVETTGAAGGAAAVVSFGFFGDLIPAMLALEAGLTLYLAAKSFVHHVERKTPGAVQAALGFGFFFLGHLLFYLSHTPGFARAGLGDVLSLVGITLLVQLLPGKK